MEKYKETKKKYNSDKTFVQISKELHKNLKEHCNKNDIKVREFLENIIKLSI